MLIRAGGKLPYGMGWWSRWPQRSSMPSLRREWGRKYLRKARQPEFSEGTVTGADVQVDMGLINIPIFRGPKRESGLG